MQIKGFSSLSLLIACAWGCTVLMFLTGCPSAGITDPNPQQPIDSDGDGVPDVDDLCPNTPAGAQVDEDGCAPSQLDSDGDGVTDDIDQCPNTPAGAEVDEFGCGPTQRDSDGDGVVDAVDRCPNTPPGTPVDNFGCPLDGNGNGGGNGGTTPVCGNGIVEAGEQCEPPNTATCNANCQFIQEPQAINANTCGNAVPLSGEGVFTFDNSNATMTGPDHTGCVFFGSDEIDNDVWSCWTAPCSGTVFVQTCGLTAVDTKIAVYNGCTCPPTDATLIACNDDACSSQSTQSLVTFQAVAGQSYLVRIGTFPGEPGGVGGVRISCGLAACPGSGACFTENGSPGCNDESCCEKTCAVDPFCCDNTWDSVCAQTAEGLCTGNFSACGGRDSGSCSDPRGNGTPGCSDSDCCNEVCQRDPFCCLQEWDDFCARQEAELCHLTCGAGAGSCTAVHATPGCQSEACCAEVCSRDASCCQVEWDQECVDLANQHCP